MRFGELNRPSYQQCVKFVEKNFTKDELKRYRQLSNQFREDRLAQRNQINQKGLEQGI